MPRYRHPDPPKTKPAWRGRTMPVPPDPQRVLELIRRARPVFAGEPAEIVGAALAELTAIWLASHVVVGNGRKTDVLRGDLLLLQVRTVREHTAGYSAAFQRARAS